MVVREVVTLVQLWINSPSMDSLESQNVAVQASEPVSTFPQARDLCDEGSGTGEPESSTKLCRLCLETRPLSEFRPQRRSGDKITHASFCNRCHAEKERRRRAGKKIEADRRLLYEAFGSLSRPETKRLNVERFLMSLMSRYGGPEGFAKQWHAAVSEASACRRIRAGQAFLFLLERFERDPEVLSDYSDQQLENELLAERLRVIQETLRSTPDVVKAAVTPFGYDLVKDE